MNHILAIEIIFFAYVVVCILDRGCSMDGFVLDHLQGFMVILYHDVPAINVGMELF